MNHIATLKVTGALMNKGGFSEFIAVMASCSAFAALMSTVDSMVIAANNVFTVDVLKNWLMADSTITQLKIASLIVSPVMLFGATAWALLDNENINLAYLLTLGSCMVWQIFPVVIISFYSDKITAYPILAGIIVGFLFSIGFAQTRYGARGCGLVVLLLEEWCWDARCG
jgi:Na+/proline symporter